MTKGNGAGGGNGNGHGNGADRQAWFSQSHNKEFSEMFEGTDVEEEIEDDIKHKRQYEEIDKTIKALAAVNKRLRKKSLMAALRSRELGGNGKSNGKA